MKSRFFRQLVACMAMISVLFGTVAPLGACWCPGCHCESSITHGLADQDIVVQTVAPNCCSIKSCCSSKKNCCGEPTSDLTSQNGESQTDDASDGCCGKKTEKNCCGCGQSNDECRCGKIQKTVLTPPETVSPIQKLNFDHELMVTVDAASLIDAINSSGLSIFYGHQHWHGTPPVPLHVLLCVFLN